MANKSTTAENITHRQIVTLREEALVAGDGKMVAICDRALLWEQEYKTALEYDATGHHNAAAAWEDVRRCDRARAECARVIAHAEAQS